MSIINESTVESIKTQLNNEHEIRYYLKQIKFSMSEASEEQFKPSYLVTAVKLPTGAIELAVNTENIAEKIDYILSAYDGNMQLITNPAISMQNVMVV